MRISVTVANPSSYCRLTCKQLWGVMLTVCTTGAWSADATADALALGDIVVVQQSSGRVYVVDPDSGQTTLVASNVSNGLSHVVLDAQRRILTTTRCAAGVVRIDPETGNMEGVVAGDLVQRPNALAFEDDSNLIVSDLDSGVIRVDLDSGTQQLITSFADVQDLEIGTDGTIFALDYGRFNSGGGRVLVIDPITGSISTLAEGGYLFNPSDMTIDANGDLLVSNRCNNFLSQILRIDTDSGSQDMLFTYGSTGFITLEDPDNLLIADFRNKEILRAELSSGDIQLVSSQFYYVGNLTGIAVVVPGPSTLILLATGALGLLTYGWRRRRR